MVSRLDRIFKLWYLHHPELVEFLFFVFIFAVLVCVITKALDGVFSLFWNYWSFPVQWVKKLVGKK